jgi:hypothetical protein
MRGGTMSAIRVTVPYNTAAVVTVSSNSQYEWEVTVHHVNGCRGKQVLRKDESKFIFAPTKPVGNSQGYDVNITVRSKDSNGSWCQCQLNKDKDAEKNDCLAVVKAEIPGSSTPNGCTIVVKKI